MGLVLHSVRVDIDGLLILDHVDLDVPSGSRVAVLGPSGAGKSTLLRVIAGITKPTSGTVELDGVNITRTPAHRRRIAMVFQDDQLFAHMTVSQNIAFGLDVQRPLLLRIVSSPKSRRKWLEERSRRVSEMLSLVGLVGFEERRPMTLSGGEAKRVALARALASSPSVVLLDEPLTGLDHQLHDRLMHDLGKILESTGTTVVLVTHDLGEAEYLADRIVRLDPPPGR